MDQYLSSVWLFSFNFAPVGWQQCNGQILGIQTNQALFALLGTNFGGNGTSTFGLPNLQGRIAVGAGQGPGLSNYQLGQLGGVENLTLLASNMPLHTHTPSGGSVGVSTASTGNVGSPSSPTPGYFGQTVNRGTGPSVYAGSGTNAMAITTSNSAIAGANTPVPLKNPYLVMNYCVATTGIFPSRN
jgi:microcystin-dependent protein